MLNVKPINRPTIPKLLKSNFIRPKAANYIKDFIKNYKIYDGNEEQVAILKEQAEKYGIFKSKLNKEINISSVEKDLKVKKNKYNINNIRKDFSNPISPEKEEKQKKFSLDKKKYNNNYINNNNYNNKKIRNKNINSNILGKNKYNKRNEYISDDNKKKRYNNKETINSNYYYNNCHRIKYSLSKKKNERTSSRPLSSQKIENNINNLIIKEHNISVINKNEENKIDNDIDNSKEKIINERINYFKKKCIDSIKEEKYEKAYNYLIKIKNKNENDIDNRNIREHLIKILGKDNIAYWHLIDQIILFEQMLYKQ